MLNKADETVFTPYGPVVGRKLIAANGVEHPKPVESWVDLAQNASSPYRGYCLQKDILTVIGSENCLHISIFTPNHNDSEMLPVFVWIHNHHSSGGISEASPETGYRDNIAARGVVAVTFNFRLGVMALNESINLGFRDQQIALQWVQDNIAYFGGNRHQVTLAASGSGAEFVLNHMKDKSSRGLFSAAILQSGQYARDRFMSCKAISILKSRISCYQEDLQCLNRKSSNDLVTQSQDLNFVPCNSHFKMKDPIVNKVPVIMGVNMHESASDEIFRIIYKKDEIANFNQNDFILKLNATAEALSTDGAEALKHTRNLLITTYMTELEPLETWFDRYIKMATEANFLGPLLEVITLLREVKVYAYIFQHISEAEMIGLPWRGVIHGTELQYLFAHPGFSIRTDLHFIPTTRDLTMVNTLGALWANFVKYGNPTPNSTGLVWQPVDSGANMRNGDFNYITLTTSPRSYRKLSTKTATVWLDELPNYASKTTVLSPAIYITVSYVSSAMESSSRVMDTSMDMIADMLTYIANDSIDERKQNLVIQEQSRLLEEKPSVRQKCGGLDIGEASVMPNKDRQLQRRKKKDVETNIKRQKSMLF
uniref:COesterase domain-containing protein n=1 Tax=Syphacia muris TaxID=451379 RepID=A0A0N5AJ34_9BILA